jgi:hypothetical protein
VVMLLEGSILDVVHFGATFTSLTFSSLVLKYSTSGLRR